MKRLSKRELAKELVKRSKRGTNWEGSSDWCPYYFSEDDLEYFIDRSMSKSDIKRCIKKNPYIHEGFFQYVNSAGNQCGDFYIVTLYYGNDESIVIESSYSQEYDDKWAR